MGEGLKPVTVGDIIHNAILKQYPDGSGEVLAASKPVFREAGWELRLDEAASAEKRERPHAAAEDRERAKRRARAKVAELARANDFTYFVTLTLDEKRIDRYDIKAQQRVFRCWLDNAVRRYGLAYVLVPERHKDGAIHYHGLFNDALSFVDSGTISRPGVKRPQRPRSKEQRELWLDEGGHIVYNISEWSFGFSTAIGLYGDRHAAIAYVCKYIGKDANKDGENGGDKIGGRWYYSGGHLLKAARTYIDVDFDELRDGEHVFTIDRLGCECCKIEFSGVNG